MIRSLAPDELEWFIASYYTFLGHSSPRSFAHRAVLTMREIEAEANKSFVLLNSTGQPLAGTHVLAPNPDDDNQNLHLSNIWFSQDASDLSTLLTELLRRFHHEAAYCPLYNFSEQVSKRIAPVFTDLGFKLEQSHDMEFALADLPPLGMPLVLEAWSHQSDLKFREVFAQAEGFVPSERLWAWLKRWRGKFRPDYWFIARGTLDQEPVGYAFYGAHQTGLEGSYYLTAAGVLTKYRSSSEMLRRLVISSMHDLATRSPLGHIFTTVAEQDPKLIQIFESLGFVTNQKYPVYVKKPE